MSCARTVITEMEEEDEDEDEECRLGCSGGKRFRCFSSLLFPHFFFPSTQQVRVPSTWVRQIRVPQTLCG